MRILLSSCVLCLAISFSAQAGTAYKWVDENGYTQISQFPPEGVDPDKVTRVNVKGPRVQPQQEEAKEETPPTPDEAFAKDVEERCNKAKENLAVLEKSKVVRLQDPDGKIKELSEAETTQQRDLAKKEVDLYCK
jgi:hypothetical protein